MSVTLETLARGKYLALTTYRKDGTPVTTPVWLVRDGDRLLVTTQAGSGKAKRICNLPDVLVASCDMRGRLTGPQVPARATLQSEAETERTTKLVRRRYGILGWLLTRRGRPEDRVGIEISGLAGPVRSS
jgi:PPOX class probable F420-dependent enzyme